MKLSKEASSSQIHYLLSFFFKFSGPFIKCKMRIMDAHLMSQDVMYMVENLFKIWLWRQASSEGNGTCHPAWNSELDPWDLPKWGERTSQVNIFSSFYIFAWLLTWFWRQGFSVSPWVSRMAWKSVVLLSVSWMLGLNVLTTTLPKFLHW